MTENRRYGATPAEWESAANSPLMPWVVPIVSNPSVPPSPTSNAMRHGRGKVPSEKNARGEAVGLRNWTNRAGNKDLNAWAGDPDFGFGVRMGRGGLVAIDCDCDDQAISEDVREMLFSAIHAAPPLRRRGSPRWACILRLKCRECVQKRRYALPVGILEILGDGQQLACAGTHPSGTRYEWAGGDVGDVVEVGRDDFERFCAAVESKYGGASPVRPRVLGETFRAPDRLADWLRETGRVKGEGREGELYIECPWAASHSDKGGETSTVYFPVGSNGYESGGFKCLHAHCAGHSMADFVSACKGAGYADTDSGDYPDMSGEQPAPKTVAKTTAQALMDFLNERSGKIDPCLRALDLALSDPTYCGYEVAYDTFAACEVVRHVGGACEVVRHVGGTWEPVDDALTTTIRTILEAKGFRTPKKQDVTDKVIEMAKQKKFDELSEYLSANIPEWDGVQRVAGFFSTYCGTENTEWTQAVGLYLFTALWARASCTDPDGVKADITPVLVGRQGTGKSTLARILALNDKWCGDLDFSLSGPDRARAIRKKVVVEIPELGGMRKREQNEVKAYMTQKTDEWTPKFVEHARVAPRRCIFIMTTNDYEFLADETGNRRWAPVDVGEIDREAVRRDILKLWAEGRELFRLNGIMYEGVERLQDGVNQKHATADPWAETISAWIADMPDEPLTTKNIVEHALRLNYAYMRKSDANALSKVMQSLGYKRIRTHVDGKKEYVWTADLH